MIQNLIFTLIIICLLSCTEGHHNRSSDQNSQKDVESSEPVKDQVWFNNTQYGILIETPSRLDERKIRQPDGTKNVVSSFKNFTFSEDDVAISHMVLNLVANEYNPKTGLRGAVSNMVNHLGGQDLKLELYKRDDSDSEWLCDGLFKYEGVDMQIRGYCYFNNQRQVNLVTAVSSLSDISKQKIDRVFESITVL